MKRWKSEEDARKEIREIVTEYYNALRDGKGTGSAIRRDADLLVREERRALES